MNCVCMSVKMYRIAKRPELDGFKKNACLHHLKGPLSVKAKRASRHRPAAICDFS